MKGNYEDIECVVQRYVLGKMSESEAEQFEEFYLSCSETAELVESAQAMNIGLNNLSQTSSLSETKQTIAPLKQLWSRAINCLTIPVPAFAVLALGLVAVPFAFDLKQAPPELNLVNFSTDVTRSRGPLTIIDLSDVSGIPTLLIKLKSVQQPHYKLKLYEVNNDRLVWESNLFSVGPLRESLLVLPTNLNAKKIRLEVVGVDQESNESIVEFCHFSEVCN